LVEVSPAAARLTAIRETDGEVDSVTGFPFVHRSVACRVGMDRDIFQTPPKNRRTPAEFTRDYCTFKHIKRRTLREPPLPHGGDGEAVVSQWPHDGLRICRVKVHLDHVEALGEVAEVRLDHAVIDHGARRRDDPSFLCPAGIFDAVAIGASL